jgi:hypothetical protein
VNDRGALDEPAVREADETATSGRGLKTDVRIITSRRAVNQMPSDLPDAACVLARFHIAAHQHLSGIRAGEPTTPAAGLPTTPSATTADNATVYKDANA